MIRLLIVSCLLLFMFTSWKATTIKKSVATSPIGSPVVNNQKFNLKQKSQATNLFVLNDMEENTGKKVGFFSVSDIFFLSENADSLAIPSLKNVKNKQELRYFVLDGVYQKRLLAKTKISLKDSVFVYDYSTNVLLSFSVKNLNVVAKLSDYRVIDDYPLSQNDYEIGFEINKASLQKLSTDYAHVLVFVGKENPFARGQMKPITWKKSDPGRFPLAKSSFRKTVVSNQKSSKGNGYFYSDTAYHYFIQDFKTIVDDTELITRHLMVIEPKSGNVILERIFSNHESGSIAPLNFGIDDPGYSFLRAQWTGTLLKNKQKVIFGFEWYSFGCPNIIFLASKEQDIFINCDNRH